jgi:GTP-binding protein Era
LGSIRSTISTSNGSTAAANKPARPSSATSAPWPLAAEITREKLFLELHQELPYSLTVETESWVESKDGKEVRIDQVIYVERDTQKGIVLGKGGRQIKAVGQAAREELETLLETRVHLFLFVKVRGKWTEDPERYQELGLDFS